MIVKEKEIIKKLSGLKNRVSYQNKKHNRTTKVKFTKNSFLKWYSDNKGKCYYCKIPGDKIEKIYWGNRKTKRPKTRIHLEVDRKKPNGNYNKENCVLVCFVCNNAKSDIFSEKEFKKIGRVIRNILEI